MKVSSTLRVAFLIGASACGLAAPVQAQSGNSQLAACVSACRDKYLDNGTVSFPDYRACVAICNEEYPN